MKMHQFDHPNVMQLIGVCLAPSDQGNGPCIVMPFMAKGSLLDHLRKEADNLFVESEEDFRVSELVSYSTLTCVCQDFTINNFI